MTTALEIVGITTARHLFLSFKVGFGFLLPLLLVLFLFFCFCSLLLITRAHATSLLLTLRLSFCLSDCCPSVPLFSCALLCPYTRTQVYNRALLITVAAFSSFSSLFSSVFFLLSTQTFSLFTWGPEDNNANETTLDTNKNTVKRKGMYLRNMNKYLKEYSRYFTLNSLKGLNRINTLSFSLFWIFLNRRVFAMFQFINLSFDCCPLIVFNIYSFADYSLYTDTHTHTWREHKFKCIWRENNLINVNLNFVTTTRATTTTVCVRMSVRVCVK